MTGCFNLLEIARQGQRNGRFARPWPSVERAIEFDSHVRETVRQIRGRRARTDEIS